MENKNNPIVPDGFVRVSDLRKSSDARIGEYGKHLVWKAMHDGIDECTSLVCLMVDVADEIAYELVPDELLEWVPENESWFRKAWDQKAVAFRGDIFSYIADRYFADEYGDAAAMKARRHCKRSALCGGRISPAPCFLSMDDARAINGETENYWDVFTAYWSDMLDEWR